MKICRDLFTFVLLLALCWLCVSYFDVVRQNCMPHPVYGAWNFFTVLVGW